MEKDSKASVGYMFKPNTQYVCGDCRDYIPDSLRCVPHGASDTFLPLDGCNIFVPGTPHTDNVFPLGALTKGESGFMRSNYGFSCKRCEHFNPEAFDCEEVDKDSPGDTPGMIHPDACCNEWEPDPSRQLPTEAFR